MFEYNARNRMDVFKIGTTLTAEYEHNAYGQRVLKTHYGTSTDDIAFHFGLGGEILGTTTYLGGGGKLHVQYVWLDGKPVAQYTQAENGSGVITSTETVYLHTDHLDTPRLATGTSGTVKWRWDADAFGVGTQDTDPDNDSTDTFVNLRFPGQYYDDESGKHYNYFRDYDVSTGRYVESDPIGLAGGMNRYAYAGGSPVIYTDTKGLDRLRADYGHVRAKPGLYELPRCMTADCATYPAAHNDAFAACVGNKVARVIVPGVAIVYAVEKGAHATGKAVFSTVVKLGGYAFHVYEITQFNKIVAEAECACQG